MKQNIYSGFHPMHLAIIACAVCLLLVAFAYLYAYICLDKAASQTLIVSIPCTLIAVAVIAEVVTEWFRKR